MKPPKTQPLAQEHPFAQYIRTLGKGKTGSRSLNQDEAASAFSMLLRDEADPLQVGAFLMLLRVKEETGEELAGFVQACREQIAIPELPAQVDLDWPSYAGKRQQHPWYILAMLLLANSGYRVLCHGSAGHTPGRLYTERAMAELGLPIAANWQQAEQQLGSDGLSYLPLHAFCPALDKLMHLKPLLGLRSPVNTLARNLNPARATCSVQSIFHPAYARLHQEADSLLQQPSALVYKGDGGEAEIKPQADTRLHLLRDGAFTQSVFPRAIHARVAPVEAPATAPLRQLWRNQSGDLYGLTATLATTAAALLLLEPEISTVVQARQRAKELWQQRDLQRLD
tara:strand:- start:15409 stop:16428 length:1020 start_codon:yes stop_codon:yes gene_type:complete